MLGAPILYLKGMRTIMFQLSGFYYMACCTFTEEFLWEGLLFLEFRL